MFGWNALALALKGQGIYSAGCEAELTGMDYAFQCQYPVHCKALNQCSSSDV